ncbi:Putative NADPH dehydrogenase C23G7.10c [Leucoagaricus sp. SymC.cos]|nr:Putative NADPH dehydrogenase C23G7.10c [Leucoagaricus sp. SymC.cos]
MARARTYNDPAPGISYFTPLQDPVAGTALNPQPSGKPIPKLFQPLKIRGVEFQNRIFVSPMCQYSAENGFVTTWHLTHLGGIVSRGPGLTVVEATAVLPEGRISPEDVGLWSDAHIENLSKIVEFAHSQSQKIGIQLAHAGRKASTFAPFAPGPLAVASANPRERGWPDDVWGPSTKKFHEIYAQPKEITKEGIRRVVQAFKDAAVRAVKAGFDVIEIHSAHGYLLSSFLSPSSNVRTDEYGGSFENRIRALVEVVDAVRSVIPETMPLFVRVSGTEWLEQVAPNDPQWRSEDTVRLAPILAAHGVDLLDVSSGGINARQRLIDGEAYQAHLAGDVKRAVGDKLLVGAVGSLGRGVVAQKVLDRGWADVTFVGREFQKNPGLVWSMADELGVEVTHAKQIHWGFRKGGRHALGHGGKGTPILS